MIATTPLQQALLTELNAAADAAERAEILCELIRVAYERTKFIEPGGGGLDERSGKERDLIAEVLDAAIEASDILSLERYRSQSGPSEGQDND